MEQRWGTPCLIAVQAVRRAAGPSRVSRVSPLAGPERRLQERSKPSGYGRGKGRRRPIGERKLKEE